MADRKRYSKRRQELLYRVVDEALIELRIRVLRGALIDCSASKQEEVLYRMTADLPEKVVDEYRRSLVVTEGE